MKLVFGCLLLAFLFHPAQSVNQGGPGFRIISIPTRENGYSNFSSIVLRSKEDLDTFIKNTSSQIGWNNRQEFVDMLLEAKVDFSKEALVLLRHSEGSGSVKVTFETPVLTDRNLHCEIRGHLFPPGYGGTADMAYYCFAVAVSKAQVSQVELQATEGGFSERRLAAIFLPVVCPTITVSCPDVDP